MQNLFPIGILVSCMLNFSQIGVAKSASKIFHPLAQTADTSQIDKHLLGKYKVIKISNGYLSDAGRVITSEKAPVSTTALLAPKSVRILSADKVEYSNLGQKMEESDDSGRITQFLCSDPGSDLKMLIITEVYGKREIEVGVVNMMESDFISYELIPQ